MKWRFVCIILSIVVYYYFYYNYYFCINISNCKTFIFSHLIVLIGFIWCRVFTLIILLILHFYGYFLQTSHNEIYTVFRYVDRGIFFFIFLFCVLLFCPLSWILFLKSEGFLIGKRIEYTPFANTAHCLPWSPAQ